MCTVRPVAPSVKLTPRGKLAGAHLPPLPLRHSSILVGTGVFPTDEDSHGKPRLMCALWLYSNGRTR